MHWVAFFAAIEVSTVAIGLLGYASFPLFVPFLERAMLGIPIDATQAQAGALLVALGLVLLVPEFTWASHTVRGLAWGMLSGFMFALLTVRTRKLAPDRWSSEMALWQNAIAALCVLPVVLWQGGVGGTVDAAEIGKVLLLGVFCTALAHTLYMASLARLPASTVAVCAALEPVYGIALALLLLREVPNARTIAGRGADRRRGPHRVAARTRATVDVMNIGFRRASRRPRLARRFAAAGVRVFGCDPAGGVEALSTASSLPCLTR